MTVAKIKISYELNDKNKKTILAKYSKSLYRKLSESFQRVYGNQVSLDSFRKSVRGKNPALKKFKKNPPSKHAKDMQKLYMQAWDARYAEVKTKYENTFTSKEREKHDYNKRKLSTKSRKTNYGKTVKYTSPALLSGHFRNTVRSGFRDGGTFKVELSHLLLHGSYGVNTKNFPSSGSPGSYVEQFLKLLTKAKVIENPNDMFRFDPSWNNKITKLMKLALEKDLFPEWAKIIKKHEG
jgi:hypothetical protein